MHDPSPLHAVQTGIARWSWLIATLVLSGLALVFMLQGRRARRGWGYALGVLAAFTAALAASSPVARYGAQVLFALTDPDAVAARKAFFEYGWAFHRLRPWAWLFYAGAVGVTAYTCVSRPGVAAWRTGIRRGGLLLCTGVVIAVLPWCDRWMEAQASLEHDALVDGTSRFQYRARPEPRTSSALGAIRARHVALRFDGSQVVGVALDREGKAWRFPSVPT